MDSDTTIQSEKSNYSRRNRGRHRNHDTDRDDDSDYHGRRGRRSRNHENSDYESSRKSRSMNKSDRSVTIQTPPRSEGDDREEVIEVQILPQDDNWGDNTTAITGTSDRSSDDDLTRIAKGMEDSIGFDCNRYFGYLIASLLGIFAFLSPIAFVVIPQIMWKDQLQSCNTSCEGLFISMSFKLLILAIGSWALFFRKPKSTLPRIFVFRMTVMGLIFIFLITYWLFYSVRIINNKDDDYYGIVLYAVSLVDALVFIHYVAVILLELRQLQTLYTLKVVRSPDGVSKFYSIGQLSIQRAAAWILEQYYRDFGIYNPHLLRVPTSRIAKRLSNFKFYDVDGPGNNTTERSRAIMAASAHQRDARRNERFYEEEDYVRRVKKRRARLEVAAEEAFMHIKRLHQDNGHHQIMNPTEAAQSIFPSLARALQKYLRVTRQQPKWSVEKIIEHLATCISYNLSSKAFLEAFLQPGPCIIEAKRHEAKSETWELLCDTVVSRPLRSDHTFQLRQGEVMLQVFVMKTPHFRMLEEAYDYKDNKFTLRLQSETSV
ncbi:vang-like protein 1 [Anneissia japonica]|uniref:vang-like protein 1 n=1 Tax=Anneissia japonica TaxID=1529436 RepID=UPI0014256C53|nr:vang-like protein 1 [Anneissia japonica]XP_033109963.1 vang-like protein 1 [Anneissia japonica]